MRIVDTFSIQLAAANYHPDYGRHFYVQLVFDTLMMTGPGLGQSGYQVIADLPVDTLTQLKDSQGRALPVAVKRDGHGQLFGAWLGE